MAKEPEPVDVLVVGLGPGGAAAAVRAHARGLRVLGVDRATFPRDKTCGDGLTARALRILEELGVDVPALPGYAAVDEVVCISPSGRRVVLPLPHRGASSGVIPRMELDAALVQRVRDAGVEIREGTALEQLGDTEHGLRATLADGTVVDATYVVAADGQWSSVRRLRTPGAPPDLGTWHAFRQYFRYVGPHGDGDARQYILFEPDLLPGYAWVFPLPGGRANVGFGVLRDAGLTGKALKQLWPQLLSRPSVRDILGPHAEPEDSHRAWPIPASFDPARVTDGRILYVGDAASVVDPMTGEGIAQALETGALAIRAIAASPGDRERVAARYRVDVDRALGHDLKFAALLQHVLRSPVGARAAIATAALTPWTRRNFARWMFEDYPRALVLTPGRWKRGALSGRGAYLDDFV
jgi:menaquinone-9 beta-reductase